MKRIILIFLFLLLLFKEYSPAQINTESLRKNIDSIGFLNSIGINYHIRSGNSNFNEGVLNYTAVNKSASTLSSVYGYLQYKDGNKKVISSQGILYSSLEVLLSNYINPEIYLQTNFNRNLNLKNRYLAGVGGRINLSNIFVPERKNDDFEMFLRLSLMYEKEEYSKNVKPEHELLKINNYFTFNYKFNDIITLYSITYHQFSAENFKNTRLISDNTIQFRISKIFRFTFSYNIRYDNEPPIGKVDTDYEIINGILIEF